MPRGSQRLLPRGANGNEVISHPAVIRNSAAYLVLEQSKRFSHPVPLLVGEAPHLTFELINEFGDLHDVEGGHRVGAVVRRVYVNASVGTANVVGDVVDNRLR